MTFYRLVSLIQALKPFGKVSKLYDSVFQASITMNGKLHLT